MNKICPYCQRPMRLVQDKITSTRPWQCDFHGEVRVWLDIGDFPKEQNWPYNITLVCLYKDSTYHAKFFHNYDVLQNLPKFRIDRVNRRPKTHEVVVTLDFHPDITPENISTKLPTLILFS